MKRKADDEPDWTARHCYNHVLGQLPIQQAALAEPLSRVERSLQRHKVRNRPSLPNTSQDLVLDAQYSSTLDGRAFVLIDDGMMDRILVFGTVENLNRLFFYYTTLLLHLYVAVDVRLMCLRWESIGETNLAPFF